MNINRILKLIWISSSLIFVGSSYTIAQSSSTTLAIGGCEERRLSGQSCAITTAVPFLMICPDSRSGAMGEAGVALADNPNMVYWNPSALAFSRKKFGVSVNYTPWLRQIVPDINHTFLPVYYNFGDGGGVAGGSLTFFSLGDINLTTTTGAPAGVLNPSEFALTGFYSRKITSRLSAGVSLRYIYSGITGASQVGNISTNPGRSFAGDVHLLNWNKFNLGATPVQFRWGANISNIGAKMNYNNASAQSKDFLPTNLRLGYAFKASLNEENFLTIANDFNKLLVPSNITRDGDKDVIRGMFLSFSDAEGGTSEEISEINWSLGIEYEYNDLFFARLGYFYEDPLKGDRKFYTVGAGIKFNVFGLDIAYLIPASRDSNHPLQNTVRFSLNFEFGESGATIPE